MADEKKPISFGFTKKKEVKVLEKKADDKSSLHGKYETDFVHALEGKEVKSTKPKENDKPLVIPLIKRNNYGRHDNREADAENQEGRERPGMETMTTTTTTTTTSSTTTTTTEKTATNSLEDDAVREIIKDAAQYNEDWEGRGREDLNLTIPLLMQNKVPEGYETDDKLDVSIRPEQATGADYNQVPIEQFGLAMLRGMGWKEGDGIGAKMKKVVEPIEAVMRPKGQGLGSDRRPGDELNPKRQRKLKPGDKRVVEEPRGFAKGVGVLVASGVHKNLYGKIEGVDEDNARLVIKLAISGQLVTLSQFVVKIVEKDEYRKYSRDLSRYSKGHDAPAAKEHSKEDGTHGANSLAASHRDKHSERTQHTKEVTVSSKRRSRDGDRDSDNRGDTYPDTNSDRRDHSIISGRDRHREKHRDTRDERSERKRQLDEIYDGGSPYQENPNGKTESGCPQTSWLRPDLRVRFIDRQYKKGRHYNSKVTIVDVVTRTTCTCQTEDGKILEDIDQSMVETLIPKMEMSCVMVVSGKLKGQLGSLVKRDKSRAKADVQLLRDRDQIVRLDYDDICEYAGNIHDEEDY